MLKVAASPQESEPNTSERKSRPRRSLRIAAGVGLLVVVLAGALYWQVTRNSIQLAFLSSRVETAIAQRLPDDARVSIGSTAISYRHGKGVLLRIKDIELLLPGMATVSVADLATESSAGVLFGGGIDLTSVTITDVDAVVSAAAPPSPDGTGADLIRHVSTTFTGQVIEADALMRAAGLEEVIVRNAAIRLAERAGHAAPALKIGEANWLPLSESRSKAWMQVVRDGGTSWDLTLEQRRTPRGNTVVSIELEDVPMAALAPKLAGNDGGPRFNSAVTLQIRMAQSPDGRFLDLRGVLSAGDGALSLTGEDRIHVASAAVSFLLNETGARLTIPSGEVRTLTGAINFEGVADLAARDHATLVGRIRGGEFSTAIGDTKTVRLIGGGGVASVKFADLGIEVERLDVVTPEGSASAIGQASIAGDTPGLSFALSMTEMSAAAMRALWPPFVAAKLRDWFDVNVKSGRLGPATLQVALPPDHIGPRNRGKILPRYALVGSLPFHDAAFSPIKTFPTIQNASGEITFANATANIVAQAGIVTVGARGTLQAAGTTLVVPELGRLQPRGDLHLELYGPAAALAEVSNTAPLSVARDRGIAADNLSGTAALSLDVNIPLNNADFSDVIPNFRLALSEFSSTTPIDGSLVEEAELVLEGNPRSYTVKGEGVLDGYRASVDLIQGSDAPDQSAVIVTLDDAARERMGIAFGQLVAGPVQAYLMNSGSLDQQIALDLKQTRIDLPFLGWEKGPGVSATASFVMEKTEEGTRLSRFLLSGKGFEARGELLIGPEGRLKEMKLDQVALRPGDRFSATVIANGSGYDVTINGSVLDARGLIRQVSSDQLAGTADIFPVRVSLDLDVVRGENDVSLSGVSGSMTVTRRGLEAASVKGNAEASKAFEWTLTREANTRALRLFADDGGAMLRFAGIYSRVAGGSLILDYNGTVGEGGGGVLVMRDFRVVNEVALKKVVEPSTARDSAVNAYATRSSDYQFAQLRIPFQQKGWVVTIDDAALRGSGLGATASGTINMPGSQMAISGTLIPAFGINNIAGAIPVLGALLGGRDEGLVGITYKLFGPLDNPSLVVNPISAIAPGIFRKIFEYR